MFFLKTLADKWIWTPSHLHTILNFKFTYTMKFPKIVEILTSHRQFKVNGSVKVLPLNSKTKQKRWKMFI